MDSLVPRYLASKSRGGRVGLHIILQAGTYFTCMHVDLNFKIIKFGSLNCFIFCFLDGGVDRSIRRSR